MVRKLVVSGIDDVTVGPVEVDTIIVSSVTFAPPSAVPVVTNAPCPDVHCVTGWVLWEKTQSLGCWIFIKDLHQGRDRGGSRIGKENRIVVQN